MRKYGWVALFLVGMVAAGGLLFRPTVTRAEGETSVRTLDVTGQATVTAAYDTASLTFGVSELKDTATEAYAAMSEQMNAIVAALAASGVGEEQLKTGTFSLQAEYEWLREGGQQLNGYRATNTLTVTTQQLDQVAELMQTAVAAGANQVQGVTFSVKDNEKLVEDALDLAVDNAKAKAERVATRLGTEIVGVQKVHVNDSGSKVMYDSVMRAESKAMGAAPAPVFSGEGDLSVSISITFELR